MSAPLLLLADLGEAFGEVNDVVPSWEAVWRLLAAAGLGALVGIEREVNDQPAGLRTHITVALGAAVFGIISTLGFSEFVTDQRAVNVQFDVT
ncbi:MAG TPA: MgtC/SapB family protein, partial [Acidimicrobiales bacterium]|nr:MgtC/SapB family protein [Acidimicrobiales bacterium]